jgi:hypothetical protein
VYTFIRDICVKIALAFKETRREGENPTRFIRIDFVSTGRYTWYKTYNTFMKSTQTKHWAYAMHLEWFASHNHSSAHINCYFTSIEIVPNAQLFFVSELSCLHLLQHTSPLQERFLCFLEFLWSDRGDKINLWMLGSKIPSRSSSVVLAVIN